MPDLKLQYDAIQLYDLNFGPRLVPVTPPDCDISPSSSIHPKDRGKAPGKLTPSGWVGVDVNNPKFRCADYATAKLWRDEWGANVGFVAGGGWFIVDNDQGEIFSRIFRALLLTYTGVEPLRRYVVAPKHERDAFFVRAVDFVGDGAPVANRSFKFRNGVLTTEVQLLASSKQAVIAGVHPGTRGPYVWSRALEGLDQIPVVSVDQLDNFFDEFVREAKTLGWVLDGPPPPPVSAPVSATASAPGAKSIDPSAKIAEAKALLDEIPNRDVPPGELPNDIDRWLDNYDNWTRVAYALAAFLGAALAATPAALDLWLSWSDGRAQHGQTSESVWKSVLSQSGFRYGDIGLIKLVRSLVPATGQDFPDLDPEDPALQTKTPAWDMLEEHWVYCRSQGFIDVETRDVVSRQAFSDDNAHLAKTLTRELRPGHRGRLPSVADLFLAQAAKRRTRGVLYAPGDLVMIPSSNSSLPVFNLWRPTTHGTLMATAAQVKPWLDHVEFVMGSRFEAERFIKWCAFAAQHPECKPNWHFLIMSLQGFGKDTLVQPVKLAVGDGNWKETLIFKLSEPFNGVVETKLLIVGETRQSDYGFTSAHDVGTRLKELLARPPETLTINKKHMHPYEIPNRVAVILFSNEENPLYLERGQRRVHVVNRRDAKAEPPDYYQNLWAWLKQGGDELAASYLLHYALTEAEKQEFIGGVAPSSDDKTELEHLNIHPALAGLEELLADAQEGKGPFAVLVATQGEIADHVAHEVKNKPSSQIVRTWLLDMERRKTGVRRLRVDPKAPHLAGLVADGTHSGRLWLLGEKAPGGREWSTMTHAEIIALWKNLPRPASATIIPFPSADEEPV
jgi:hypothetical protein